MLRMCSISSSFFDASADGCVGSGDYAGFTGCYLSSCDECANCWPETRGGSRAAASSKDRVSLQLVAVRKPSPQDAAAVLPASISSFTVGESFYLELWAGVQAAPGTGFAAVHADITYSAALLTVQEVTVSDSFGLFPQGMMAPRAGAVWAVGGGVIHIGRIAFASFVLKY